MNSNNQNQYNNIHQTMNFNNNTNNSCLNFQNFYNPINNNIQNYQINNNGGFNNNLNNIISFNNMRYNIIENENEIFIVNIYRFDAIKISKNNPNQISRINYTNELPKNIFQKQACAIIGFFDLYNIKYLAIVSSSEEVATILESKVYLINSIELIKITNENEPKNFENIKNIIKSLFSTKNFYYSNDYKLSASLEQISQNNNIQSKYLANYSLLKNFYDNNIPEYFYCQMIFGFVSSRNNINISNNQYNGKIDLIIIERYFHCNINISNYAILYIKQVEFITVFKDMNDQTKNKIFSNVNYLNNEYVNNTNTFVPFKITLVEELNKFQSLVCIVNNLNKDLKSKNLKEVITKYNKSYFNDKICTTTFSNEWKKFYLENINFETQIDFYSNDSIQQKSFWLIDINNNNFEHKRCYESLIRLLWEIIRIEINNQKLELNLGNYVPTNENIIYKQFNDMANQYLNSMYNYKRLLLLNQNHNIYQEIFDKFLNINYNKPLLNKDIKADEDFNSENFTKFKMLFVTWNIGGFPFKGDIDISEIFMKNYFYNTSQFPDIVIISIQEIVPLKYKNIRNPESNKENVKIWTQSLKRTLNKVFPEKNYNDVIKLDLIGLFIILLVRVEVLDKMIFNDYTENKKGKFGYGNKGYFTFSFQYSNKIFSIASGHLESGSKKNNKRIKTLEEILNRDINVDSEKVHKFKDADYWILLGDLNFRIDLTYETAISLIQEKNYFDLYGMDQFHLAYEDENYPFLKENINEGPINFGPTYKFEKNSDAYDYDDEKIRVPSWCDRIFFCKKKGIRVLSYESIPNLKLSDHRPVSGAFEVLCGKSQAGV